MESTNLAILSPTFIDDQLQAEKSYWLEKLSGDLAPTGLPLDFKRPATFEDARGVVEIAIDPDVATGLIRICNGKETLIFAALAAALKICLHKYSGAEDIVVGTAIHEQYEEVASLNRVLALRTRINKTMAAKEVFDSVRQTIAESYANQKFPFERILELLDLPYQTNRAPLFDIVVLLENINNREHVLHVKNDITLIFALDNETISGEIEFNSSLYKQDSIEMLAAHFNTVLGAVLDSPELEISQINLLSESRRRRLVYDFNDTSRDYPSDATIHDLFDRQAALTPEAVAIVSDECEMTYAELRAKANSLARRLRSSGVGPGSHVGLCLEHSPEEIVAILGVLKAGAAYVPLDPAHPMRRLAFIVEDSKISTLLTQEHLVEGLPPSGLDIICVGTDEAEDQQEDPPEGEQSPSPDDPAYIIYTSGSTGEPKGVRIRHSSLVNYVWWAKDVYLRGESLAFSLYSSLAFDLTVTSIFTPLITGNRIRIYRRDARGFPVTEILKDPEGGVLKLTPSHLTFIKEMDNTRSPIKRLIVGGEALETELARRIHKSFGGDIEIFNEYGPTEATVGCMIYKFDIERDDRAFVPIGRPAANTQIYILDSELRPVPDSVVGELFISGKGLADGYLDRPELTGQRFIDNPFVPGGKMYRTGDLARWLSGEIIEFVGRNDDQVKFHGQRIELSEIRAGLNQHPQIRDSVAMLKKDRNENEVLVAYYVSRQELEVAPLRIFLAERLIQETIPNVFIRLEMFPLTLNGKVDYGALPTLEEAMRLRRNYVAPRNEDERVLAEIWEQVLGIEQVGIQDDFFELGGHSLLATQVTARARDAFQVELPMTWLFEAPTLADLALIIDQIRQAEQEGGLERIEGADRISADELLAKLDQLSDDKVDSLLNSMVARQDQAGDSLILTDEEIDSLYQEILAEEEVMD